MRANLVEQQEFGSSQNPVVVIATYNERANMEQLLPALLALPEGVSVVVVDDNSPDGTGEAVAEIAEARPGRIELIRRPGKLGYGSAFVAGLQRALEGDAQSIVSMDADFSHDPQSLPELLRGLEDSDLVIGSRYLGGIRILNWSLWRLLLSLGANRYVRFLLRFDVGDCTRGYRAYPREVLRQIDFERVGSNGYSFLVEILEAALSAGYRAAEVPIVYEDRQRGESKMDRSVMLEAVWKPWVLLIRRRLRSRSATQTDRAR